ncbi:glycosyltransferase family 4 protein [Blastococcus sp. SYSU D00922]
MKIAHLLPTSIPVTHDRGGAVERRVLALAQEQVKAGHEVTIFSAGEEGVRTVRDVRIYGIPYSLRRPFRDYEYLYRVRSALRAQRFDVIHSHGVPDAARILGRRARHARLILTVDFFRFRATKWKLGKRLMKTSLRAFHRICPVSEFCRDEFLRFYGADYGDRTSVVYNGVSTSQFFPDDAEAARVAAAYGLLNGAPYVLYLGRLNRQKGSDALPELALALKEQSVVAAGPVGQFGRGAHDSLVDALHSAGGRYLGPVPESDLRGLLSGAIALVLPTRRDEMFGMVLIEAGACGTPAVASNLGGIPEALGEGGYLAPVGDVQAFAQRVTEIASDDVRRRDLQAAALRNALRFTWEKIAEDYADVYRSR